MTIDLRAKEKLLALGVYPATSLKQAREKHQRARENLANGILTLAHIRKPHPRQRTLRWQTASNYSQ
jgi:hypothetical protein